jgi:meso-butanediol dehydrogenase/(S,S)-butanediol dehydrogenase/diacetyl reductase
MTGRKQTNNKVAIITGAAAGIGKACARRLAEGGMRVVLSDVDAARLDDAIKSMAKPGAELMPIVADVAIPSDCDALANAAIERWGRVDVLVANAGVQIGGSLEETSPEDWSRVLDVNLNGVAWCCRAVLPAMREQGGGSIVIVSSVNAIVGSAGMAVYDMSKAGVLALMRNIAAEYGTDGVRANAVCPGNTITDFHIDNMAKRGKTVDDIREFMRDYGLLGRAAEPAEIANAVHFLASDEASFVTGHALMVDGGYSITGKG